jgi:hypothetical protein
LLPFAATMKHFRSDITLHIHLINLKDEHPLAEKMINLLGYYKIESVKLDTCYISLCASCMFLLQPPSILVANNSYINFCKTDQVINARKLKLVNTRVHCKVNNPELFRNVKRAVLNNILIKEMVFTMFSHNLEELVIQNRILESQTNRLDILRKIIKEGYQLQQLRLLSVSSVCSEESLLILIAACPFPKLEVLKVCHPYLRTTA